MIHVVALQVLRAETDRDHHVVDRLLQLHYHELSLRGPYDVHDAGMYRAREQAAGSTRWLVRDPQGLIGVAVVRDSHPYVADPARRAGMTSPGTSNRSRSSSRFTR